MTEQKEEERRITLTERQQLKLLKDVEKGLFPDLETALKVMQDKSIRHWNEEQQDVKSNNKKKRPQQQPVIRADKNKKKEKNVEDEEVASPAITTTTTTIFLPAPISEDDIERARRLRPPPLPIHLDVPLQLFSPLSQKKLEQQIVSVIPDTSLRNHQGGPARVVSVSREGDDVYYHVQYSFNGIVDTRVPSSLIVTNQTLDALGVVTSRCCTLEQDVLAAAALQMEEQQQGVVVGDASKWVRRSTRQVGSDQLSRANVIDLLARLKRHDPDLKILRLKNWLEADTSPIVFERILELLKVSRVVQALYCQNLEQAVDDKRLAMLCDVLRANKRIWALNVGENFRVTRQGWETFARALPDTHITHLYAGSESTVSGALKVQMRNAVRENRAKHDLHDSKDNLDVIGRIGQMWWCPRHSKNVQAHMAQIRGLGLGLSEGTYVAVKTLNGDSSYRIVRAVKTCPAPGAPPNLTLVYSPETDNVEWLDLDDPKLGCTWTSRVVWASNNVIVEEWPALQFPDIDLVAWTFGSPPPKESVIAPPTRVTRTLLSGDALDKELVPQDSTPLLMEVAKRAALEARRIAMRGQ